LGPANHPENLQAHQAIVKRPAPDLTVSESFVFSTPKADISSPTKDIQPTNHHSATAEVDPYDIAAVLLNKGHIEEAINELHQKLATHPNFAPAHTLLGRAYANQGQWIEARRWCESALKLDNLQSEAYYVLALVHEHEENYASAIDFFKKAVYLERDNPLFHFNLAVLYKKTRQTHLARRTCQNAIKILEKWPPGSIVPDTDGATAKHLLDAANRILHELEGK